MAQFGVRGKKEAAIRPHEQRQAENFEEAFETKDLSIVTEGKKELQEFLSVDVSIGTKTHTLFLARALASEMNVDDITDRAINQGLHWCTTDRAALVLAAEEIRLLYRRRQREFLVWKGSKVPEVRDAIIQGKIQEQINKGKAPDKVTSTAYAVTDREIEMAFATTEGIADEFERRSEELELLESNTSKFNRLEKIVGDRGMHLMNIANRRLNYRNTGNHTPAHQ